MRCVWHKLVVTDDQGSRLWGIVRTTRKFGIPLHFLDIGSFDLATHGDLKSLFGYAAHVAGVRLIYLSMNPEGAYFQPLNFERYGQPIIVKGLNGFDVGSRSITFFGGMRDTF